MGKIAARDFFVHGAANGGENRWFHPGDEIPNWAQELITNESVYANPEEAVLLEAERDELLNVEEPDDFELPDYSNFKVAELKEMLDERGLETSGTKALLVQRLEDSDAALG